MNASYGFPRPPIATTVMVQKQEMVSPQFGIPLFREFDYNGLLLDLFGNYDGFEFDVLEASITGTRFSVIKLVSESLRNDMIGFCERKQLEEDSIDESEEDRRCDASIARRAANFDNDLEGRN